MGSRGTAEPGAPLLPAPLRSSPRPHVMTAPTVPIAPRGPVLALPPLLPPPNPRERGAEPPRRQSTEGTAAGRRGTHSHRPGRGSGGEKNEKKNTVVKKHSKVFPSSLTQRPLSCPQHPQPQRNQTPTPIQWEEEAAPHAAPKGLRALPRGAAPRVDPQPTSRAHQQT